MPVAEFDALIAGRIQAQHNELAARWFDRLLQILPVDSRDVFPSHSLLDHIPALITEVGRYLGAPDEEAVSANTVILDKARELGQLRHDQRASLHQVLREYHILGAVLTTFVIEETERLVLEPPLGGSAALVLRLQQAINVLSQATVETFIALYTATIADQSRRLEEFTRLAAHEWRQPLSTLQFGLVLLRHPDLDAERASRTWAAVDRNLGQLIELTRKLEAVTRLRDDADNPLLQAVSITAVAREAARQLRDMADAKGVEIVVQDDMPELTVDVGRLELALINLLSNGIKYADPAKPRWFVQVSAALDESEATVDVTVRDNGVGIPDGALQTVFRRFTRAHADHPDLADVPGIGLGLAIVEDCVREMGGRILVDATEGEGTSFTLRLPVNAAARA